ncbi:RNA-directed RNA polymerase [ssRNA phage SRR6960551_10]|uniref:RNA-directed RNA polymerase n=1 Tax=ssRNA phage SRR6960551_10 TaxID=2786548 RepID=A0A8S5L5F7_9VIRU|nr:RNA-directed RNA polymerase [ssRNA phage SRR6960551_10]DAD52621.1 TPA_asm: RNA-directed RNA polymerase [ssRNA phage SRR6960551_10]
MSTKRLSKRHRMVPNAGDRVSRVFFALCKNIGTPVALGAWLRYKYGEHAQLASMSIDACDYTSSYAFHGDYICVSFLSKYKGLKTNIDTKDVALQAFKQAELSCAETNKRFVEEQVGVPAVEAVISLAQRKISKTLGVLDPPAGERGFTFTALRDTCRWGPGATFSLSGEDATVVNKICESRISVTPSALPLLRKVMADDYHWHRARGIQSDGPTTLLSTEFQLVRGSKITVVPKNAKTDRTIGIEPTGNLFLQLGIGAYIRSQLLRVGVNLNDQSRNQRLAQRAVRENLATMDLKSASDSISVQAILQLFPLEWVELLGSVRSPYYLLDGEWHAFEKWSSMGNGYTFELESLIFWALASSVSDFLGATGAVSVYGDDVILPCECAALFSETLAWLGFTVNESKSFSTGLFRESCGIHVFDGYDVTPIYQKEIPNVLEEVHRLANRIGRLAYRMGDYNYLDPRLRAAHAAAIAGVVIRYCVPLSSEDDDGFALPISALSEHALKGAPGRYLKLPVLVFRPTSVVANGAALLAYKLRFEVPAYLNGKLALRRRGTFSVRRRWYPVLTDADWLI